MRTLLLLPVVLLLSAGMTDAKEVEPGSAPEVGAPYPALRLPTIDGKSTIDLRQLRGKKVLLIEFASW